MKATLFSGCGKAADTYEFPVRCGFLNETYAPISDETAVSVASEVSVANLQDEGLWPLMKLVVRKVLAEGASFTKTVYLAGTGLGGSHAALISMWLKTLAELRVAEEPLKERDQDGFIFCNHGCSR